VITISLVIRGYGKSTLRMCKLSMYAQTLARVPRGWFDEVVRSILDGTRRLAIKEIYLQAWRMYTLRVW
jgi:hypothetical protein